MGLISTIGILECSSIAVGYEAEDAMLKAGAVSLVLARTICSGKFMIVVSGDVDAVKASVQSGCTVASGFVVDELVLPYVHPDVLPALGGTVALDPGLRNALGVVETFSAISAIKGADAAAKAGEVILLQIHLAMAVGGKGYFTMTGDVASIEAAVNAAIELIGADGMLAGRAIIRRPRDELFQQIM